MNCPFCGKLFTSATSMKGEHVPKKGDITMCIGCGKFSVLDRNSKRKLTLREPDQEELRKISQSADCAKLWFVWQATKLTEDVSGMTPQ
jgi:hypothetical protein